ncbi:MAG: DNA-binding protein [Candidatus Bathyarchaeia archaeon]
MEAEDYELEEIKRRRVAEMQRRLLERERNRQAEERARVERQVLLTRILSPEARSRLTNLRMVRPEFVEQLETQLIQAAQAGRINAPLSDEELRQILQRLQSQKREIKIRRV